MSLDWTERIDWRAKYFGLPARRMSNGCRSHARVAWDAEHTAREARKQEEARLDAEHQRRLAQPVAREPIDALVTRFGSAAVTALMRRYVNPAFGLPADAAGADADAKGQDDGR